MSDIRKSIQDLDLGIDDSPVTLSPDFISRAAAVNRFSLVVTAVNPRKQNLRAMIAQMPRVWGLETSCVGRVLGNGKAQFVFQNEESLNLVLRRGPWSFNDWMVSVHRWYPNITDDEMKIIHFWVQIKGIPLLYLTGDMARCIGNKLAPVTDVDFDVNRVEFVRVRMAWNFDSPLRFKRNFHFGYDENSIIQFRFERLQNFCTKCGSLKHDLKGCSLEFGDDDPDTSSGDDDDHMGERQNPNQDISETNTLETIDPQDLIPGLQVNKNDNGSQGNSTDVSSLPSVFEDTELTAEKLRFLHTKLMRGLGQDEGNRGLLVEDSGKVEMQKMKRKRSDYESILQGAEAAEDMAILSYIHKRGKMTESAGSTSIGTADFRRAGGPEPLKSE